MGHVGFCLEDESGDDGQRKPSECRTATCPQGCVWSSMEGGKARRKNVLANNGRMRMSSSRIANKPARARKRVPGAMVAGRWFLFIARNLYGMVGFAGCRIFPGSSDDDHQEYSSTARTLVLNTSVRAWVSFLSSYEFTKSPTFSLTTA